MIYEETRDILAHFFHRGGAIIFVPLTSKRVEIGIYIPLMKMTVATSRTRIARLELCPTSVVKAACAYKIFDEDRFFKFAGSQKIFRPKDAP